MRRIRKWCLRSLAVLAILIVGFLAYQQWNGSLSKGRLGTLRAKLDADDPGWRFEQIQERRKQNFPPDEQNIALVAGKIDEATAKAFNIWSQQADEWLPVELNQLPTGEKLADAKKARNAAQKEIDRVLTTRTMEGGGVVPPLPPNPVTLTLEHTNRLRLAAALLRLNANVLAAENDGDAALESCRAMQNLTRGINDEPTFISVLVRCAINAISIATTERVLAYTQPKKGLEELQAALLKEANAPFLADSIRGERGLMDLIFDALRTDMSAANQLGAPAGSVIDMLLPTRLLEQHIDGLVMRTRSLEIVRGPSQEWLKKFRTMTMPAADQPLLRMLVPADEKVILAALRTMAKLQAMATAIACERYRLANGRWPKELSEIPKTILEQLPVDPYTGQSLRYLFTPTGIKVYSVGPDETDDGGNLAADPKPGTDLGVQLFSPEFRRTTAPVKE